MEVKIVRGDLTAETYTRELFFADCLIVDGDMVLDQCELLDRFPQLTVVRGHALFSGSLGLTRTGGTLLVNGDCDISDSSLEWLSGRIVAKRLIAVECLSLKHIDCDVTVTDFFKVAGLSVLEHIAGSIVTVGKVDISYCPRLAAIGARLVVGTDIFIRACPRLSDLSALAAVGGTVVLDPQIGEMAKSAGHRWLSQVKVYDYESLQFVTNQPNVGPTPT